MVEPLNLRNLAWALTTTLEVVLFLFLLRRRLYRSHPAFFTYIIATIIQSPMAALAYSHWGFQTIQSWNVFWCGQGIVVCARWLAIVEIARKTLASYPGIWKLANRLLFAVGISALAYSVLASAHSWQLAILYVNRGVELSIAAFLVSLFLIARYYRLPMADLDRYLAIGFSLYSCFWVINASLMDLWGVSFENTRNFLEIVTFLASLLLWIGAVRRHTEAKTVTVPAPVSRETYAKLSLAVNTRLHLLNERLVHLRRTKDSRP